MLRATASRTAPCIHPRSAADTAASTRRNFPEPANLASMIPWMRAWSSGSYASLARELTSRTYPMSSSAPPPPWNSTLSSSAAAAGGSATRSSHRGSSAVQNISHTHQARVSGMGAANGDSTSTVRPICWTASRKASKKYPSGLDAVAFWSSTKISFQ